MQKDTFLSLSSIVFFSFSLATSPTFAAQVVANGTTVNLNGGTASTTTNGDPAILSTNSGLVNANGATVTTTGDNANGATATLNGRIIFNGSSVSTSGNTSYGLYADQGGSISANGTFVSTTGPNGYGIVAGNGGTIFLGGPTVQTSGLNGYGIVAMTGGTISGSANVTTNGNGGTAIYALGGNLTYTGGSIVTHGTSSAAVGASLSGTLVGSGFSAQTTGATSVGAAANSGGNISLSGASIQTFGTGSYGAIAFNPSSSVSISNGSLQTFGANASGMVATNSGTVSLANAGLTTSGANAPAFYLSDGGTANVSNANPTAQGTGSYGLFVDNTFGTGANTFNISNGTLSANSADSIRVDAATVTVNTNQATINASTGSSLLFATNGSVANINGDNNSHFNGTITANASTANLALTNGSSWSGRTTTLNNLSIDSSSRWDMTLTSIVTGTTTLAGTIDIAAPQKAINTLTLNGPLVGQNGNIIVETTLNSDNSPSDIIRIGDSSQGATGITVNNFNGVGQETNQGILVVNSVSGGVIGTGSFYLKNAVVAGPYEYLLYRNGNNLYLRNTAPSTGPTDPPSIGPGEGGDGEGIGGGGILPEPPPGTPLVPIYRPDVSLATALPSLALFYDNALLGKTGTLHQRTGQPFYLDKPDTYLRKWIRYVYEGGLLHNGTIYDRGPNFDYTSRIVQMGADVFNTVMGVSHRFITGLFGALGNTDSYVDSPFGGSAGHDQLHALSLGGYFTYLNQDRWYIDATAQGTQYRFDANSYTSSAIVTNGTGFAGSVESGYRYPFLRGFAIQPQAQVVMQTLGMDNTTASSAKIRFNRANPYAGRLGLLGEYTSSNAILDPMTIWLRGNYWRQFNGNTQTQFSSATGYIPFSSPMPENSLEAEVGISAKFMKHYSVFGTLSRSYFSSGHGDATTAILGVSLAV